MMRLFLFALLFTRCLHEAIVAAIGRGIAAIGRATDRRDDRTV